MQGSEENPGALATLISAHGKLEVGKHADGHVLNAHVPVQGLGTVLVHQLLDPGGREGELDGEIGAQAQEESSKTMPARMMRLRTFM